MSQPHHTDSSKLQPPWQPRFGLATLMLAMLVFSVMGAAGFYLVRGIRQGTSLKAVFVIFTLAAPMLLLVALSAYRQILVWLGRLERRKHK
jgi:hypothetical protein